MNDPLTEEILKAFDEEFGGKTCGYKIPEGGVIEPPHMWETRIKSFLRTAIQKARQAGRDEVYEEVSNRLDKSNKALSGLIDKIKRRYSHYL